MSDQQHVTKQMSLLGRKLWCFLIGHQMYVWQEFHPWSRRVVCDHCGGDWGMNDCVRVMIPWSKELERLYEFHDFKIKERTWTL